MEFSNVHVASITAKEAGEATSSGRMRLERVGAPPTIIFSPETARRDPTSVYRRGGRGQWRRGEYKGSNLCQSRKREGGSCVFDFPPAGVAPRVSRAGP